SPFKLSVEKAALSMRNIKRMEEKTDIECPKCGSFMVVKWGKSGSFLGCSRYPECNATTPYKRVDGKITPEETKKISDVKCTSCGANMMLKRGRFGEFLGCSRYPECSTT